MNFNSRVPTVMVIVFAALLVAAYFLKTAEAQSVDPISGVPRVIEGDLLQIGNVVVRLYGIDTPEKGQTCEGKTRVYPCGHVATLGLMDLLAGIDRVVCTAEDEMPDGTLIAMCRDPQGFDLSQQMLYTGWAFALPDAPFLFHQVQEKAQKAKRGLWKGTAIPPWRWRRR